MATFRVGQRVRMLPTVAHPWSDEGIVEAIDKIHPLTLRPACWVVSDKPHPADAEMHFRWAVATEDLQPLTDPGADAFMERIKKLKPYEEPKVKQQEFAQGGVSDV